MAWHNSDGLYIRYGTEEATIGKGGEYNTLGHTRTVELVINLADLTETETVLDRNIIIPQDWVLYQVRTITDTAAATGTAIDVGLVQLNVAATEIDYNGILDTFPIASMNLVGETQTFRDSSSDAGVLVGTVMSATYPSYITASRTDATAFTAGRIRIQLDIAPKSATT